MDFIILIIFIYYDLKDYFKFLIYSGELVFVGFLFVEVVLVFNVFEFIYLGNCKVYGLLIGGIKEI